MFSPGLAGRRDPEERGTQSWGITLVEALMGNQHANTTGAEVQVFHVGDAEAFIEMTQHGKPAETPFPAVSQKELWKVLQN